MPEMAGGAAAEPIGSRLFEVQSFVQNLGHRLSSRVLNGKAGGSADFYPLYPMYPHVQQGH
jgi:hypothetical protein